MVDDEVEVEVVDVLVAVAATTVTGAVSSAVTTVAPGPSAPAELV